MYLYKVKGNLGFKWIIWLLFFVIWPNNPKNPDRQYITQVWKVINHDDMLISNRRTILIGNFNSNTIWDRTRREGNHFTTVKRLEQKGIYSIYHKHFNQKQGSERHPTVYMHRRKDKPYHMDYCFVSMNIAKHLKSVEVCNYGLAAVEKIFSSNSASANLKITKFKVSKSSL